MTVIYANFRERVDLARSFATTVFPVGRPVVVGIPYADTRKPAVTIRYYPSAPCDPSLATRRGRRWFPLSVGHLFAGLTLRQLWGAVQRFTPNALRLPTISRGRRDLFLGLNLFGPFQAARRSFRAPLYLRQEPSGRAANTLELLRLAALHESNLAKEQKHEEPKSRES
jgi:hypothetical protein